MKTTTVRGHPATTLVAFPSTGIFGVQAALAFAERDELEALFTTFVFDREGALARGLRALPGGRGERLLVELERRSITALPPHLVEGKPFWEVIRTLADKGGLGRMRVDRIWDHMSRRFTIAAGQRLRPGMSAVYAYEYSALEAFAAADRLGIAKILDFPSLNSRQFQHLQRAQKEAFPELAEPLDDYFEAVFEARQARRDAEMRAADIIITNSTVTRASHIAGGADPERTFAVPCGAPPVVESALRPSGAGGGPLKVIWAGSFSIGKGAHFFLNAWNQLNAGVAAKADIFGAVRLPDRIWQPVPHGMTFHGSVVRKTLFAAFQAADVLIFPSLSDGFGMVVTEAFSHGLPVITTDRAGASDLVREGENGLVIPAGDEAAITRALQWCLDNRAQLAGMSAAALETARGWQWADYRKGLYAAVEQGLVRAGKPVAGLRG